ncbi:MAG: hypothetical protein ACREBR_02975 [bacterium]
MDVFRAVPSSPALLTWATTVVRSDTEIQNWRLEDDSTPWLRGPLIGRSTFWTLSPFSARQAFSEALMAWVEDPLRGEHIFFVPRVLQRSFGRVSKHILFMGQFTEFPASTDFVPVVPFLLFYLPPFRRRLPTLPFSSHPGIDAEILSVDVSPFAAWPGWVRSQVSFVRGL